MKNGVKMFDTEYVKSAKQDAEKFKNLHTELFKDIDSILYKYNIQQSVDRDELKSQFNFYFVQVIFGEKYQHGKVDFFRWMHMKFRHIIIDFHRKNCKRLKRFMFIDELDKITYSDEVGYGDFDYDIDFVLDKVSSKAALIAKFLIFSDMERLEIMEYLDLSAYVYQKFLKELRFVFSRYISGMENKI